MLRQGLFTFRAVLKDANFGELFVGNYRPEGMSHLFLFIQILDSQNFTKKTAVDFYDYIVVDEFHHAAVQATRSCLSIISCEFCWAGYVESWGRGIQKICEAYGTAMPEYIVHSENIMVKLSALPQENVQNIMDSSKSIGSGSKGSNGENEPLKEPIEERIIKILMNAPNSMYDLLAKSLDVSRSTVKRMM